MDQPSLDLNDYQYHLPEQRIAQHPLQERDGSKLLIYNQGEIHHQKFRDIGQFLPNPCTLVFNDTKVIPARLFFKKETGALIEIFLLNPLSPSLDLQLALQAHGQSTWSCMIGNRKRWKPTRKLKLSLEINERSVLLAARQLSEDQVELKWEPADLTFAEILEAAGRIPLPPYMKRSPIDEDFDRYQTVYSQVKGAVAAPTAGLHFTDQLLESLAAQGVHTEYLTLHVGAGTFQPIKASKVQDHTMHGEQMIVSKRNIEALLQAENLVAVGTTSLRTLESLYWYGVKLKAGLGDDFFIEKLLPYHYHKDLPSFQQAMKAIQHYMRDKETEVLQGTTEIFIFPPYQMRSCQGLITNFHLPGSTLILLVAAFVGDSWREIYTTALEKDYRFLSYGDASLLLAPKRS